MSERKKTEVEENERKTVKRKKQTRKRETITLTDHRNEGGSECEAGCSGVRDEDGEGNRVGREKREIVDEA